MRKKRPPYLAFNARSVSGMFMDVELREAQDQLSVKTIRV